MRRAWTVMRVLGLAAAVVSASMALACAAKEPPPVVPGAPHYPDFVFPAAPDAAGDAKLKTRHAAAWRLLQAGDARGAAREYGELLKKAAGFYPGETGLGYALVADGKPKDGLVRFDKVLQRLPAYAPALVGRGEALIATGQPDLAIASFESARASDAGLTDLSRRIDVLRFARVNELVAAANRAAVAGRLDEARQAFERALAASPGSAFLARDLALVELRAGAYAEAIGHLRAALASDADDVRAWVALAEASEKSGQLLEAMAAMERVVALDPTEAHRKALERLQDRSELSKLPQEYRAIPGVAQVTRGDLAALLGVKVVPLMPGARRGAGVVVTDARTHWASTWILSVTRAGVMEAFPNHTFQPRNIVRRIDLAWVVSRVLPALGVPAGRSVRPAIADVAQDHLSYAAVSISVASGVMPLLDGGVFRPSRIVTGAEAVEVVGRLEALARKARPSSTRD